MSYPVQVPKYKHEILRQYAQTADQKEQRDKYQKALKRAEHYYQQHQWWVLASGKILLDRQTGLIWEYLHQPGNELSNQQASIQLSNKKLAGLDWVLPTKEQLLKVVGSGFPLCLKGSRRILERCYWMVSTGSIDLDYTDPSVGSRSGCVIGANRSFLKSSFLDIILHCSENHWNIALYSKESYQAEEYKQFTEDVQRVVNYHQHYLKQKDHQLDVAQIWANIDRWSIRLPKLEPLRFTDMQQGMWEFYVPQSSRQEAYTTVDSSIAIRSRNPELDVQNAKVAIDFGTSSTVVAIRRHGKDELLRIGMQEQDFKQHQVSHQHFENPTILQFIDLQAVIQAWHSEAYRPLINWKDVRCSHEALIRFRENDTDPSMVSSVFARLKQWALRDIQQAQVRLSDQSKQYEYEFEPLTELHPVKGQMLSLDQHYPDLDPIELYAWFLGMNINWRERGIYLNYYMTFPVSYANEVKEKILASFRRGLLRSLPESLMTSEAMNKFSVKEIASEPAAFAACALPALKIEPSAEGVPYAVFDFGGGTTDFDYGIYRLATEQEYEEGIDDVLEHFGAAGDQFLGGENLIENLAYLVFKHNHQRCRDKEICFTQPIDADSFLGSERLIAQTQAAYTNTTLMMSYLRGFWEKSVTNQTNETVKLTLLNRHGQRVSCDIDFDYSKLQEFLISRIQTGLKNFFIALKASFTQQMQTLPEQVHILLAGNSSRSRFVLGLLGCLDTDEGQVLKDLFALELNDIFADQLPQLYIHPPLEADQDHPAGSTAKTGVALGLLRVSPGENLKVINHVQRQNIDSPFHFFVGTHRRGMFMPKIKRGDQYKMWYELGPIRDGIFPLLYTTQHQALHELSRGTGGLKEQDLEFVGQDTLGKKVFGRILGPDSIEIGLAVAEQPVKEFSHCQIIQLK